MLEFSVLGSRISVSVGFLGTICLMLYIDKSGLMLPTLAATLLHEAGHITALFMLDAKPNTIELRVGAIAIVGSFMLNKKGELWVNAAGPVINILLFLIFSGIYFIFPHTLLINFALVNLAVALLNILPVTGLDGGSIVYLLLCEIFSLKATKTICLLISLIMAVLILILGVNIFITTKTNPSLILLALYLILGLLISKKQKNYCNIFKNRVQ